MPTTTGTANVATAITRPARSATPRTPAETCAANAVESYDRSVKIESDTSTATIGPDAVTRPGRCSDRLFT